MFRVGPRVLARFFERFWCPVPETFFCLIKLGFAFWPVALWRSGVRGVLTKDGYLTKSLCVMALLPSLRITAGSKRVKNSDLCELLTPFQIQQSWHLWLCWSRDMAFGFRLFGLWSVSINSFDWLLNRAHLEAIYGIPARLKSILKEFQQLFPLLLAMANKVSKRV